MLLRGLKLIISKRESPQKLIQIEVEQKVFNNYFFGSFSFQNFFKKSVEFDSYSFVKFHHLSIDGTLSEYHQIQRITLSPWIFDLWLNLSDRQGYTYEALLAMI